ncbi:short-chain dehydrogenase [Caballeronia hypogeia]|uniref:Short-chain dehydrogenase n=1 Tax=Caballeronia hypogeia TaxID=1777140 RepID=A0A158D376_9BURK|nr:glucose 1-dehydrogenase [Caballeronia hypogeia]SAK88953.1 short-chain dehydrogenase [Caballeronia hypogeia]
MDKIFALEGKKALVTGASSGLGAHFAKVLAQAGAEVVIAARRTEALDRLADEIRASGGKVATQALDVTDTASRDAAFAACGRLDVLINNAGIVRENAALKQSEADWDAVLDTNLRGCFFMAQGAARLMREGGGGSIVNIASILGLRQAGGVLPYAVSKAGVIQMTATLALELARYGVRVNAIAPGYFNTEINADFWDSSAGQALIQRIPQRRLGELPDLNGPLLLLASDASRYMSGVTLAVDGGHLVASL